MGAASNFNLWSLGRAAIISVRDPLFDASPSSRPSRAEAARQALGCRISKCFAFRPRPVVQRVVLASLQSALALTMYSGPCGVWLGCCYGHSFLSQPCIRVVQLVDECAAIHNFCGCRAAVNIFCSCRFSMLSSSFCSFPRSFQIDFETSFGFSPATILTDLHWLQTDFGCRVFPPVGKGGFQGRTRRIVQYPEIFGLHTYVGDVQTMM
jgi:hypothetical protein